MKKKLDEAKKAQASSASVATDNQDSQSNFEVYELPRMKTGRPLLLQDELDGQAQESYHRNAKVRNGSE